MLDLLDLIHLLDLPENIPVRTAIDLTRACRSRRAGTS
jgi:hypothetical protein